MVSKCSNPRCSASFLYLHTGRLFRLDSVLTKGGGDWNAHRPKKVEFFWLCDSCAPKFTLVNNGTEMKVVALAPRARAATASL